MKLSTVHKQRLAKLGRVTLAGAMVVSSLSVSVVAPAQAAQLAQNSTTISDSGTSAVTTYVISFQPPSSSLTTLIDQVDVKFCAEAGNWADTCNAPAGFNLDAGLSTGNTSISSTFGAGGGTAGTLNTVTRDSASSMHITITAGTGTAETAVAHTITMTNVVTNPSGAATYYTRVKTSTDVPADIDVGESAFAILSPVTVSGRVLETLTFNVGLVGSGSACGTYENSTVASTTATVPFGNFVSGTPRVGCQTIATGTNADGGYATTIKEVNGGVAPVGGMCRQTALNCNASGGQTGVASTDVIGDTVLNATPAAWTNNTTFGLGFGVSGADKDSAFTVDDTYRSLFGVNPINVSSDPNPTTTGDSTVYVVFKADVTATQTAGNYQNAIEYITTPLF